MLAVCKDMDEFLVKYGPDRWSLVTAYPDKAYLAREPTLHHVEELYGQGIAVDLCKAALGRVFSVSPQTDPTQAAAVSTYAQTFAASVMKLKPSELCLFFGRFQTGLYGKGLAKFDLKYVGQAYNQFSKERRTELAAAQSRQAAEERVKRAAVDRQHAADPTQRHTWRTFRCRILAPDPDKKAKIIHRFGMTTGGPNSIYTTCPLSPESVELLEECKRRKLVAVLAE